MTVEKSDSDERVSNGRGIGSSSKMLAGERGEGRWEGGRGREGNRCVGEEEGEST